MLPRLGNARGNLENLSPHFDLHHHHHHLFNSDVRRGFHVKMYFKSEDEHRSKYRKEQVVTLLEGIPWKAQSAKERHQDQ